MALAAQGFATPRPAAGTRLDARHLRRGVSAAGLLQIDSVNVLVRSHELPLFARLGPYPRGLLARLAYRDRELYECWAHMASFAPVAVEPLLRWKAARHRAVPWAIARDQPDLVQAVLAEVAARGPLSAGELSVGTRSSGSWWGWGEAKTALEWLFLVGDVAVRERRANFERVYDLTERVLPAAVLGAPTPEPEAAQRALVRYAAARLGVATVRDLADYFRLKVGDVRPRLSELVEDGAVVPVAVKGWSDPALLDPSAAIPRRVGARALLSPFDSLIWDRARLERLFGVHLRIEIYTPAPLRVHGYYVLPFLLGERVVARVDLKADRQAGRLLAPAIHSEGTHDRDAVCAALAAELGEMARWLDLPGGVEVGERGDLADPVRARLP